MPTAAPPNPTWLYRLVHVDNLSTLLTRGALYAPHITPNDGLPYRPIHNVSVQANRHVKAIPCGPGGTIHDYVPFYFGPLSVMLLNLKTGRVVGYDEGQEPLIYLLTTAQIVQKAGVQFVFSDGHGLATFTDWYDDLARLASNENPDGCSPAVLAALAGGGFEPWRYADPACTALRCV